jgi:hypothetical protein
MTHGAASVAAGECRAALRLLLPAALTFALADTVLAQSSSCDQFKQTLAARIDATNRGFTLETIPGNAAVPSGTKVVGTCEGGARKILLVRAGSAAASAVAAMASSPASVPQAARAAAAASVPASAAVAAPAATPAAEPLPAPPTATTAKPVPAAVDGTAASAAVHPATGVLQLWPWFLVPLLLVLSGVFWAWFSHHRAYDAAGLPRGPRLN